MEGFVSINVKDSWLSIPFRIQVYTADYILEFFALDFQFLFGFKLPKKSKFLSVTKSLSIPFRIQDALRAALRDAAEMVFQFLFGFKLPLVFQA